MQWLASHAALILVVVPVLVVVIAFLALLVNRRSGSTARRSLAVSERQELRRQPDLRIEALSATCEVRATARSYIFDLLVRNPSDTANSVVSAELWLDYAVSGEPLVLKLAWRPPVAPPAGLLVLPLNVDANKAVAGSLHVEVPRDLLAGVAVDRLRLVLTDTFDGVHVASTEFVQERVEDGEGTTSG